jgi:hypothetical protein
MADGSSFATMWIALQPLTTEETLEFVAGSHIGPMYDNGTDGTGIEVEREPTGPKLHGGGEMRAGGARPSAEPDLGACARRASIP